MDTIANRNEIENVKHTYDLQYLRHTAMRQAIEGKIPAPKALFWLLLNHPYSPRICGMYYSSLYPTRKEADFQNYLEPVCKI